MVGQKGGRGLTGDGATWCLWSFLLALGVREVVWSLREDLEGVWCSSRDREKSLENVRSSEVDFQR